MILTKLCDHNCVISARQIEQGVLYKKVLDLLDEESISGESSGRASLLIRREVLLRKFEKVSLSLSTILFFFGPQTYILIYVYIYIYI